MADTLIRAEIRTDKQSRYIYHYKTLRSYWHTENASINNLGVHRLNQWPTDYTNKCMYINLIYQRWQPNKCLFEELYQALTIAFVNNRKIIIICEDFNQEFKNIKASERKMDEIDLRLIIQDHNRYLK